MLMKTLPETLRGVCRRRNIGTTVAQASNSSSVSESSSSTTTTAELQRTCLYDFHVAEGGKMVDFTGWEMPVQYKGVSVGDSVVHCRKFASIFDVSHMLQTKILGKHRYEFMESLVPSDLVGLKDNTGTLSVFTNQEGGIEDDLIVSKTDLDYLYVVTNAGCRHKDLPYMKRQAASWRKSGKDVDVEVIPRGLIALQGPLAKSVVEAGLGARSNLNLSQFYFMNTTIVPDLFGAKDVRITRCGYTGEDGFEISVDEDQATNLCQRMMEADSSVQLCGLGGRDALRLEAGLCLYGTDINETTTPMEAALAFVVAKRRRAEAGFPGSEKILAQIKDKTYRTRRVGIVSKEGRPPRHGALILNEDGSEQIGSVTSGCPSPSLGGQRIAMGYVSKSFMKSGTRVQLDVTGGLGKKGAKLVSATVAPMPFQPTNYYISPKQ